MPDPDVEKRMTPWGIGPKFAAISLMYGAAAALAQYALYPEARFVVYDRMVNLILGASLAVVGLPLFLVPAFTIDRYFNQGRLCTEGVYACMRHPIYGAWISFIVPGITIIAGSVIGLTIPPFMYLVFRGLIAREERYLEEKYGEVYQEYRHRVWAIFPTIWRVKP
jgi:protein-S-isoprenylcysteine O-methyltransferase Ste14